MEIVGSIGQPPAAPKGPFGLPLEKGLEWINSINIGALVLVAVAGAVVAVCTFLIIKWQGQLDLYKGEVLEHYKASVAGQVAEANQQGLAAGQAANKAHEIAARAEIEIAKANERAAGFEKEAAEARERTALLEAQASRTEKFAQGLAVQQEGIAKKVQAAPSLSDVQIQEIGRALLPFAGTKVSIHVMPDVGATRLGGQLQAILKIAKLVDFNPATDFGPNYVGVKVAIHKSPGYPALADRLLSELVSHGIRATGALAPDLVAEDVVGVYIGPE